MMGQDFLQSAIRQFETYKSLGEKTFAQVPDEGLGWQYNSSSNSIGTIVKHLGGNMLSRWSDFLTTDGEKEWRDRESEFENDIQTREQLLQKWNEGWDCLFRALRTLTESDLLKIVYIRNSRHTVTEAINRQLAHYSYHVGQIVYIGRMIQDNEWQSLSIPRGKSKEYNDNQFTKPRK
jgi:hypothetical protein